MCNKHFVFGCERQRAFAPDNDACACAEAKPVKSTKMVSGELVTVELNYIFAQPRDIFSDLDTSLKGAVSTLTQWCPIWSKYSIIFAWLRLQYNSAYSLIELRLLSPRQICQNSLRKCFSHKLNISVLNFNRFIFTWSCELCFLYTVPWLFFGQFHLLKLICYVSPKIWLCSSPSFHVSLF